MFSHRDNEANKEEGGGEKQLLLTQRADAARLNLRFLSFLYVKIISLK